MKTRKEIEALKTNWLRDPCWDVEGTEGFEAHHDELLAFRETAIDAEADQLRVHGLLRLVRQLEETQRRQADAIVHLTEDRPRAAWCALSGREDG